MSDGGTTLGRLAWVSFVSYFLSGLAHWSEDWEDSQESATIWSNFGVGGGLRIAALGGIAARPNACRLGGEIMVETSL